MGADDKADITVFKLIKYTVNFSAWYTKIIFTSLAFKHSITCLAILCEELHKNINYAKGRWSFRNSKNSLDCNLIFFTNLTIN